MELWKAMEQRHAVRAYRDEPLEPHVVEALRSCIDECNREGGLHIQLVLDEPKAFDSTMARYGKFSGVRNYVALIGKKGPRLEEFCGYYGEKIVLEAQQLGLNSCWVAMSYKKIPEAYCVDAGEKLTVVIALGYGENAGVPHKSRAPEAVSRVHGEPPAWFARGVRAALLAPTAMNQQKFCFELEGNRVSARAGFGFYSEIDLGIAKYHFKIGAGRENFEWA